MDALLNILSFMFIQLTSPAMKSSSAWAAFIFLTILGAYFSLRVFFGSIAVAKENSLSELSFLSLLFPLLTVLTGFFTVLLFVDVFLNLTGFFDSIRTYFLDPFFSSILPGILYQNAYRSSSSVTLNLLFSYCILFISLGFLFLTRLERNLKVKNRLSKIEKEA